ncbi:MAG: zinc ribbon domain-containing protein [Candidatus Freyrarchaeum guaymaensis]
MGEKCLGLGVIGATMGIFFSLLEIVWCFFNLGFLSNYGFYTAVNTIATIMGYNRFVATSGRYTLLTVQLIIFSQEMSKFFQWIVITSALFAVCGVLTGIGLYGMRQLKTHRMEECSLIVGVVLSPLVFFLTVSSIYSPFPFMVVNVGSSWFTIPVLNGTFTFLVQLGLLTVFVVFGLTLIVTAETTGKSGVATASGVISIISGLVSAFVFNLPIFIMTPKYELNYDYIRTFSPLIFFTILFVMFWMMITVFRSARKIAEESKLAVKGVKKPSIATKPLSKAAKVEETEKVVVCPFCGASISKKEKKCPKCGGVLI